MHLKKLFFKSCVCGDRGRISKWDGHRFVQPYLFQLATVALVVKILQRRSRKWGRVMWIEQKILQVYFKQKKSKTEDKIEQT